jgi:hypothetical protein
LAALAVAAPGCAGSNEQTVARVGAGAITTRTLAHWASVIAGANSFRTDATPSSKMVALGFLIDARWMIEDARELGLSVSSAECSKQLDSLRYDQREHLAYRSLPKDPQLRKLLIDPSVDTHDKLWLMRLSLLAAQIERRRLSQAQMSVNRTQIARFYRHHRASFLQRQWREIEILGNYERAVVLKAKRQVEAGRDFISVARSVSIDPEAPQGLQSLSRGQEEPPFEKVVFAARPGVLVGPVRYGFYYLFRVLRARSRRYLTLAETEAAVRRRLAEERAAVGLPATFERKWIARTSCRPGFVIPQCKQATKAR